ncbi:2-hydroxyacid dehydrogenase [Azospirillum picis]|uniref:Lactate dehydrogenase-like 2-hydroxyacid dehydrogenase n=1 Tax=Azospirillum picis TaxID=488438 RepID=A0ABU0ME33_9PROT|nr:D-glycerate dehydrogenase [Azospirillum picis]MBP2297826.1 lactate dehydrogenase-like 2-hydroxyacid dehydrogenase [Azospirillum picis]MDQ0531664.1 lactate dehydrogenase-like 2-hydroxyacid dehydrogenase [Azospirillum picis]
MTSPAEIPSEAPSGPSPAFRPVLLLTRRLPDAVEARAGRDYQAILNRDDRTLDGREIAALAGETEADAVLCCAGDRMDAAAIAALPQRVRILATFSVGTDHIDVEAARARGLTVTNTPDVLTDATADIALLLLLGAARRASEGERMIRDGSWTGWTPTQLMGTHVGGKRLGIVGMGRIGQAVAQRARAFGMAIHYSNRRRLPAELEEGATYHADPEAMLPVCDVLSLHFPSTAETRHWLNAARIERLPAGAILVNTARGSVVDDEAVIAALASGRLAAAGLDVFENEPNLHPGYRSLPNAFLLPHLGSATVETRNAMGFRALDNIDAVFSGRPAPDRVV